MASGLARRGDARARFHYPAARLASSCSTSVWPAALAQCSSRVRGRAKAAAAGSGATAPKHRSPPSREYDQSAANSSSPARRRSRSARPFSKACRAGSATPASTPGAVCSRPLDGPLTPPSAADIDPVAHALNRLTFGPGPGDHARVAALGVDAFIEEQLAPEKIDDGLCDRATARFAEAWWEPVGEAYEEDDEALTPDSPPRRRCSARPTASASSSRSCASSGATISTSIPARATAVTPRSPTTRHVIRKHALGNFREMLRASALSPAMLWYLDGRANVKRTPDEKPNENYARELMELHTLGVHGGYTQQDVMEVARCLTGWTILAKKDDGFSGKLLSPLQGPRQGGLPQGRARRRREARARPGDSRRRRRRRSRPRARHRRRASEHRAIHRHETLRALHRRRAAGGRRRSRGARFRGEPGRHQDHAARALRHAGVPRAAGAKFKRPFHFVVSALRATNAEVSDEERVPLLPRKHGPRALPLSDARRLSRRRPRTGTPRCSGAGNSPSRSPTTHQGHPHRPRRNCARRSAATPRSWPPLLNRQPAPEESDAFLKSGDGLALLLASPAFQRC